MKKLINILILFFVHSTLAGLPDIIALVNDVPITRYDFETRKKLIININGVDVSNPANEIALNRAILNTLIEEEMLNQHIASTGQKVTKEQLDHAISTIEQRNNMPAGGMAAMLRERGLDIQTFRKQILAELVRNQIISSFSHSISLSPSEVDMEISNISSLDFDVEAWIFTSKTDESTSYKKLNNLKKHLRNCDKIDEKLYKDFAYAEKFNNKIHAALNNTKSIMYDTKVGTASTIYEENGKFKLVFLCKKEPIVSPNDLAQLKIFLSNKKMSKKAGKFFKDLRAKAQVKIMVQ